MERRTGRLALYAGIVLVAGGLVVLYLGYNGAATHANQVQQLPYLVSGGFGGLVLVVLGAAALLTAVLVLVGNGLRDALAVLHEAVQEMTEVLSRRAFGSPAPPPDGAALVWVPRGASSFHRPDCRLVGNKRSLRTLPREEAERTGLLACRVCKP